MSKQTGAQLYAKLKRLVVKLEKDPKADPNTLAAAREALAAYEALSERLKEQV